MHSQERIVVLTPVRAVLQRVQDVELLQSFVDVVLAPFTAPRKVSHTCTLSGYATILITFSPDAPDSIMLGLGLKLDITIFER